jgi:hypothetical protein
MLGTESYQRDPSDDGFVRKTEGIIADHPVPQEQCHNVLQGEAIALQKRPYATKTSALHGRFN